MAPEVRLRVMLRVRTTVEDGLGVSGHGPSAERSEKIGMRVALEVG